MYAIHYEAERQRALEARAHASRHRLAHRAEAAQRWQRLAAWAAHRSAMAERAARETHRGT